MHELGSGKGALCPDRRAADIPSGHKAPSTVENGLLRRGRRDASPPPITLNEQPLPVSPVGSLRPLLFQLIEFLRAHETAREAAFGFADEAVPVLIGRDEVFPRGVVAMLAAEDDVAAVEAGIDLPLLPVFVFVPPAEFHAHGRSGKVLPPGGKCGMGPGCY